MNCFIMGLNNMFGNRKSQAASANLSGSCKISTVKSFKNSWQMFLCNTVAIIADFNQDFFPINFVCTSFNSSIVLSIFYTVINKIDKSLPHFFFISKNSQWQLTSFLNKTFYFFFISFY